MAEAPPSCRTDINSTPFSTSACEILKFAVPSKPKQRRAPSAARSLAKAAATVEGLLTPYASFDSDNRAYDYIASNQTNDRLCAGRGARHVQEDRARGDRN